MDIAAVCAALLLVPAAVIGLVAGVCLFGHGYQPRQRPGRRGIVPPPPPAHGRRPWAIVLLAALVVAGCPGRFLLHYPLSFLPGVVHRALTDPGYLWGAVKGIVARPVVLL
jgi:hypothetical protein